MEVKQYIKDFEKLGFGLFIHFGLYSVIGKGEWYITNNKDANIKEYNLLPQKFDIKKTWARDLVRTAKLAGCKYITLTTRHHDGFSLYDTKGLNDFDAPHSKCQRDLIKEFTDECHKGGIVPFFYHTLLDWHNEDYKNNFQNYIDYLDKSIEILCTNYGKIGGFWFDGMWDKPDEDWQENRIYGTIRKYQPEAMIINNTGLSACGKVGHYEIDSVTFERGKPAFVDNSDKYRAGEMCQVLNDHWGYAKNDCNYKSIQELLENLIDCRKYNCNFLLNTGLKGDGTVNLIDKGILLEIGKWISMNKKIIYNITSTNLSCNNADILTDGDKYYAVIKNVSMSANPNVQFGVNEIRNIKIENKKITSAKWLDNNEKIDIIDGTFDEKPFYYGISGSIRIAQIKIK